MRANHFDSSFFVEDFQDLLGTWPRGSQHWKRCNSASAIATSVLMVPLPWQQGPMLLVLVVEKHMWPSWLRFLLRNCRKSLECCDWCWLFRSMRAMCHVCFCEGCKFTASDAMHFQLQGSHQPWQSWASTSAVEKLGMPLGFTSFWSKTVLLPAVSACLNCCLRMELCQSPSNCRCRFASCIWTGRTGQTLGSGSRLMKLCFPVLRFQKDEELIDRRSFRALPTTGPSSQRKTIRPHDRCAGQRGPFDGSNYHLAECNAQQCPSAETWHRSSCFLRPVDPWHEVWTIGKKNGWQHPKDSWERDLSAGWV